MIMMSPHPALFAGGTPQAAKPMDAGEEQIF